jgi:hypothetical protein
MDLDLPRSPAEAVFMYLPQEPELARSSTARRKRLRRDGLLPTDLLTLFVHSFVLGYLGKTCVSKLLLRDDRTALGRKRGWADQLKVERVFWVETGIRQVPLAAWPLCVACQHLELPGESIEVTLLLCLLLLSSRLFAAQPFGTLSRGSLTLFLVTLPLLSRQVEKPSLELIERRIHRIRRVRRTSC